MHAQTSIRSLVSDDNSSLKNGYDTLALAVFHEFQRPISGSLLKEVCILRLIFPRWFGFKGCIESLASLASQPEFLPVLPVSGCSCRYRHPACHRGRRR